MRYATRWISPGRDRRCHRSAIAHAAPNLFCIPEDDDFHAYLIKSFKYFYACWWIVQTTVRPVSTVFLTVLMTIAAARASKPVVGSSMKIMEGLATNSTAIVSLFRCSADRPWAPGRPTMAFFRGSSSTKHMTSSTNI
ncbi:hypothetical protein M5K25_007438 [Dendrobium thyrsiflorum]|uniref:Uncharacterized protein n=1 Tax=Dendrobium thyrsiflorum TaxID=117978 RepID=A0ABD0VEC7_DENTH